jgi:hypothetical protein
MATPAEAKGKEFVISLVTTAGRTHYFAAPSAAEADEWMATFKVIGGEEETKHNFELRLAPVVARRLTDFGPGIRTLFANFDGSGSGSLKLTSVAPMYKLLTLSKTMESVMADLSSTGKGPDDLMTAEEFVEFVVQQQPDSHTFEARLGTASAIKPLFVDAARCSSLSSSQPSLATHTLSRMLHGALLPQAANYPSPPSTKTSGIKTLLSGCGCCMVLCFWPGVCSSACCWD